MTSVTEYYAVVKPKVDYSSYLSLIEEQRITFPLYPKCEPGLHFLPNYVKNFPTTSVTEIVKNEAFEYRGIKNFGNQIKTDLYLEFSRGIEKEINKHKYLYIPINNYTEVLNRLPSQIQYSISDRITRRFYTYSDSPLYGSTADFGGVITQSNLYRDRPLIERIYPSFWTTLDSSVDIRKFYKIHDSRQTQYDYQHPLLPGFIFTGRSGMYFDREVYYEYFDWDGIHSPKWSRYYSILRPLFLPTPLGSPSSLSLVQDSCLSGQIGNYPSHSVPEFIGKFTGYITNCSYHPHYVYYLYETSNGSNFLYQSHPADFAEEVYKMIPFVLKESNTMYLTTSSSSQSYTVQQTSTSTPQLTLS